MANTDTGDRLIRATTVVAVACVGLVAAVLSYRHQFELAAGHGESELTARLVPFSIDGLLLAGTLAVLDAARRQRGRAWAGRVTVALGVAMTLWANVVHGVAYGPAGVVISGWPPVALIAAVEVLAHMIRPGSRRTVSAVPEAVPAVPGVYLNGSGLAAAEAEPFAADLKAGKVPGIRRIRDELHVGQPRAQEIQGRLAVLAREGETMRP